METEYLSFLHKKRPPRATSTSGTQLHRLDAPRVIPKLLYTVNDPFPVEVMDVLTIDRIAATNLCPPSINARNAEQAVKTKISPDKIGSPSLRNATTIADLISPKYTPPNVTIPAHNDREGADLGGGTMRMMLTTSRAPGRISWTLSGPMLKIFPPALLNVLSFALNVSTMVVDDGRKVNARK